ncbi:LPS translocon maturation chaperone LptM [Rheinheimera sp.]|uniref:LPS translocon maturation chaperone LptM n=1 Tax=Rheinheimera sp. TaxID=1869214 RepID=UPI003AF52240
MNTKRQTQLGLGLACLLLVACGQKGPLTLPKAAPKTPPPAEAPATTEHSDIQKD